MDGHNLNTYSVKVGTHTPYRYLGGQGQQVDTHYGGRKRCSMVAPLRGTKDKREAQRRRKGREEKRKKGGEEEEKRRRKR